jgi:hypothetical protein
MLNLHFPYLLIVLSRILSYFLFISDWLAASSVDFSVPVQLATSFVRFGPAGTPSRRKFHTPGWQFLCA